MNLYHFIRPILFQLDPEFAHSFTLKSLAITTRLGLPRWINKPVDCQPIQVMGLTFPNPVGLAAGLDKNGDYIEALVSLGFGFLEIGTITPRPQPGNPKPRMFRIKQADAIINRLGFNNRGVDYLVERLKITRYLGILGINIGKNFDTPIENAVQDYLVCMRKVYPYASYIAVNVSSPNTKNLRDLQQVDTMSHLLQSLKKEQAKLQDQYGRYVPIAVKIAPDLTSEQITDLAEIFLQNRIDAVIATNTTTCRDNIAGLQYSGENGGLSGGPLFKRSTEVVSILSGALKNRVPIIAVGGILTAADASKKMAAGASLVQLYSGLIYKGPDLISQTVSALNKES